MKKHVQRSTKSDAEWYGEIFICSNCADKMIGRTNYCSNCGVKFEEEKRG